MASWDMKNHKDVPVFTYVKIKWCHGYKGSDRRHLAESKRLSKRQRFLLFIIVQGKIITLLPMLSQKNSNNNSKIDVDSTVKWLYCNTALFFSFCLCLFGALWKLELWCHCIRSPRWTAGPKQIVGINTGEETGEKIVVGRDGKEG